MLAFIVISPYNWAFDFMFIKLFLWLLYGLPSVKCTPWLNFLCSSSFFIQSCEISTRDSLWFPRRKYLLYSRILNVIGNKSMSTDCSSRETIFYSSTSDDDECYWNGEGFWSNNSRNKTTEYVIILKSVFIHTYICSNFIDGDNII